MTRVFPRPAALAALFVLLAAAPSRAADGAGMSAPAPPEMADSLRFALPPSEPPVTPLRLMPLLLDTADFGFGASVVFGRLPDAKDLNDLGQITSVQHVVVTLAAWPAGYEAIQPFAQAPLPEGSDLIVILPGYPPTRAAAEAWNYLRIPLRIVLVVDGPPPNRGVIDELNRIRGLERVVADVAEPSRSGFERLQRPLSFRVIMR